MLETVAIAAAVLAAIVVALLAYAATRPDTFRIARSTTIDAPPESIFPLIDDFRRWAAWSPYEKLDPNMTRSFSGAPSGRGAVYEWNGNKNIGQGRIEVTESRPHEKVVLKLDFFRPFEAHNVAEFTLEPQGGATRVTWAMHGPNRFMSKLMGLCMNFDRMVGGQFEEGLANLKARAES